MAPIVVVDLTSSPEPDPEPSEYWTSNPAVPSIPPLGITLVLSKSSGAGPFAYDRRSGLAQSWQRIVAGTYDTGSYEDEGYHSLSGQSSRATAADQHGLEQARTLAQQGARHGQSASIESLRTSSNGLPKLLRTVATPSSLTEPFEYYSRSQSQRNTVQSASETYLPLSVSAAASPQVAPTKQAAAPSALGLTGGQIKQSQDSRKRGFSVASLESSKRRRVDNLSSGAHYRRRVRLNDVTHLFGEERVSLSDEADTMIQARNGESSPPARQPPGPVDDLSAGRNMNGERWSAEEDALLLRLRSKQGFSWAEIVARFNGRTPAALQVRYSTIRQREQISRPRTLVPPLRQTVCTQNSAGDPAPGRSQRLRKPSLAVGFRPWKEVSMLDEAPDTDAHLADVLELKSSPPTEQFLRQDRAFASTTARILRQRALGLTTGRAWASAHQRVGEELKENIHRLYSLRKHYQGTSGDVISLAWNPTGTRFAAGSVAISDDLSMQYNMPGNLLVGDHDGLDELAEHHVDRPYIAQADNVNAQHSMRASQDQRLFLSVTAVAFAQHDPTKLYTAGADKTVRHYKVGSDSMTHQYAVQHPASVDLLAVGNDSLVASGCHQSSSNVLVFECHGDSFVSKLELSPQRANSLAPLLFPSALKWGQHSSHRNLLLAGFAADEDNVGETCLWDGETGHILFNPSTRNVFDVAWNPTASSASIAFAVAGNASGCTVGRGMQSVIQCFSLNQVGWKRSLEWECPASDINDVVFCPHDDNLIAAGATDGKVYVWDKRSADQAQKPLHILSHGESLNVLNHDQAREVSDTGIRFLSWGSTRTRLYSGSSDGIVRAWNPYRSADNAHVEDIAAPRQHRSAVMSGAFSPDYRELLMGTEDGRINLFEIDAGSLPAQPFKFRGAPAPTEAQEPPFASANSMLTSGEIEIRSCGGMPVRQAVQGPNYAGPFLRPTREEYIEAEERYDAALNAQCVTPDNSDHHEDASKSAARIREAQVAMENLQQRSDHFDKCAPKARAFQVSLRRAEEERLQLMSDLVEKVEPCKLDCAGLPSGQDTEQEVEDSRRSELRIPGFLRWSQAGLRTADAEDAALTCSRCNPFRSMRGKSKDVCASCLLKQVQLTSTCSKCLGPARVVVDASSVPVCESCSFACFRCGGEAAVSTDSRTIECSKCDLKWEARALGYELVNGRLASRCTRSLVLGDHEEELGEDQREYYASRWENRKSGEDGL